MATNRRMLSVRLLRFHTRIVAILNRWYALDLNVADARLLDRRASVRAPVASSKQAIEDVEQSAGVRFGYQGENKVLRDTTDAR